MVKLAMIVLSSNSGLGNQTRRLCEMLKPYRILAVDLSGLSKNKTQHWDWYEGFTGYKVTGFPTDRDIDIFLKGVSHVLCVENPFNLHLLSRARQLGIKVYIQSNWEFCDHLNRDIELPTKFLMPSYWKVDEMKKKFGEDRVIYLPPPLDPLEFKDARDINIIHGGKRRLLHIIGTLAVNDRNGTLSILQALKYCKSDFTLTIKSQHELPSHYYIDDPRVKYDISDTPEVAQMYKNYDALILPRRYGGLSLTTNEALMSGLPVIMTDISPNNELLPENWLVKSTKISEFMTRTMIDIYEADPLALAQKIDWIVGEDCEKVKIQAFDLAYNNFSPKVLRHKYEALFI